MKSALNGGLNLSVRDGWWDEWFDGANGWSIPSADGVQDPDRRDELESAALYDLLAQSVAPLFYDRNGDGLPRRWLEMILHTLGALGPRVQAARMVREYVTELYVPAARASRALTADSTARGLATWKRRVTKAWPGVRIDHVEAETGEPRLGATLAVRVSVALGELSSDDVAVELVYGRAGEDDEIRDPSYGELSPEGPSAGGVVRYSGEVELSIPGPFGYTVRVLPRHPLLASRAELGLVTLPEVPAGMTNGDLR
jgi:starch phosphorylase